MKVNVCALCGEYHSDYDECDATGVARKQEIMIKQPREKEKVDNRDSKRDKKDMRRPPVDKMVRWEYRKN